MLQNEQTKLQVLTEASRRRNGECAAGAGAGHRRPGPIRVPVSTGAVASPSGSHMGFFATFWTWLNGQLATYIGNNTARLAAVLEPAVVTLATLYVMAWGYLHLTGQIDEPFVAGLKRIVMLAVVFGVGCTYGSTTPSSWTPSTTRPRNWRPP